jgi:hypothetical protein
MDIGKLSSIIMLFPSSSSAISLSLSLSYSLFLSILYVRLDISFPPNVTCLSVSLPCCAARLFKQAFEQQAVEQTEMPPDALSPMDTRKLLLPHARQAIVKQSTHEQIVCTGNAQWYYAGILLNVLCFAQPAVICVLISTNNCLVLCEVVCCSKSERPGFGTKRKSEPLCIL